MDLLGLGHDQEKAIPMWYCGPLGAFTTIVLTVYYYWINDGSIGNLDIDEVVHKVIQERAHRDFHASMQDFALKNPLKHMF